MGGEKESAVQNVTGTVASVSDCLGSVPTSPFVYLISVEGIFWKSGFDADS